MIKQLIPLLLLLTGCASFSTTQTDERINEKTGERTKITTQASTRTFFDSTSQLTAFKASQTDKTQGASVGSLAQEAHGSNVVAGISAASEAFAKGLIQGAK